MRSSNFLFFKIGLSLFSLVISELLLRGILSLVLLNQVTTVIEQDDQLFWRQRSHLNIEFEGAHVLTDHHGFRIHSVKRDVDAQRRILVLGASPSFGWGVEAQKTYSALLDQKLEDAEVFNASQIGFSSHQGLKLVQDVLDREYKPTHVIISYLINDLDYFRFFYDSDQPDHLVTTQPISKLQAFLSQTGFFRASRFLVGKLKQSQHPEREMARVPRENYRQNLSELMAFFQQRNVKVLLLSMPVNVQLQTPTGKTGDKLRLESVKKIQQALPEYHQIQREVALEYRVELIHAHEHFSNHKEYLFLDPERDTIHPNEKGHELLADLLLSHFLKEI